LVVLVVSGILSLSMVISSSSRSWLLVDASGEGGGRECCFGDGLGLGGRQEQVHKGAMPYGFSFRVLHGWGRKRTLGTRWWGIAGSTVGGGRPLASKAVWGTFGGPY
jgi:hypothetical protein